MTEKDKTLQEVIDWCEQLEIEGLELANALLLQHDMAAYGVVRGQINAYEKTANHCRSLLGYSGNMPTEVPNQSEDTKKSSVLEPLPHDMGLRVKLDTNETYCLKSGWKKRGDGIYGLAVSYTDGSGIVSVSRPDKPVPIAIMNSHVRLAVSFDEHETETTRQNEDTNMKETNR
ncbi:hypothetical protein [Bifidobacterium catenulatum]|uniref:hypothetical protein n=1 Tax=Bifidobacterium catenulatum TaxID=1686 RepID=UPI001E311032|nr:hypothetical protein [Bifidobacterium catenulatum]